MPWEPGKSGNVATQFEPGRSGNPRGRPRRRSLTEILREILEADTLEGMPLGVGQRVADLLVAAMLRHALAGDAALLREILNRIDGKVPDTLQIERTEAIDPTVAAAALAAGLAAAAGTGPDP